MKEPNLVADCLNKMQSVHQVFQLQSKLELVTMMLRIMKIYIILYHLLKSTGVKTFIIHARKAMLGKFTPKQNLKHPTI